MKAWEETWRIEGECILLDPVQPFDWVADFCEFGDGLQPIETSRAKLAAEAPAMWRLLAAKEWGDTYDNSEFCLSCAQMKFQGHKPDCEWLRIAKAIGHR